jgi:mannitol/fructose-specific phosphotransferase system IIA component (Ntr-type)
LKAEVGDIAAKDAHRLVQDLMESPDAEHVKHKLLLFRKAQHQFQVCDPELILTDVDASTKEQAIKVLVDRLYIAGRTEEPVAVENALWQRESTYSAGLGFGFAIPHCDCEALLADTISVMKLARPIEWDSVDGQPVSVLIFLGRWRDNSSAHLKAFATLSRCLMQEDFRRNLQKENDASRIAHFLQDHLGVS